MADRPGGSAQPTEPDGAPPAGHTQSPYALRFEWGVDGLAAIAPGAATVVIVDVLRFTSAVSVAVGRGAAVLPYVWTAGDAARAYARRHHAELRGGREHGLRSLSPVDLAEVTPGSRLVLPSPNGSTLAFGAEDEAPGAAVVAGCLRNASAVATVAAARPGPVAVVAAGERWRGSLGPLRPSVEDLVGAGAVLRRLIEVGGRSSDDASPEARTAMAAFDAARGGLDGWLRQCSSGRELIDGGCGDDVGAAAVLDAESVAPVLDGRMFAAVEPEAAGPLR